MTTLWNRFMTWAAPYLRTNLTAWLDRGDEECYWSIYCDAYSSLRRTEKTTP